MEDSNLIRVIEIQAEIIEVLSKKYISSLAPTQSPEKTEIKILLNDLNNALKSLKLDFVNKLPLKGYKF